MANGNSEKAAALITGGGRGLGRVIATRLANHYKIIVVGRTEADLASVCEDIRSQGHEAGYVIGDVSVSDTAYKAAEKAQALGWNVTRLICNAGIGKSRATHELGDDEWRSIIDTNLNGSFYFAKAFLPDMVKQKSGVVCFISSIAGVRGYAYEAAYVSSKHAVVGLSKTIASEYGKHGISSVAICPNFVEGEMTERTISGLAERRSVSREEAREIIEKKNPQRRIIPADEVAEMVSMVCSNAVPSLSGSPIIMGGHD